MAQKQVQDAYIVAATRTPIGRSHKGYFRNTRPDDLLAHVLREAGKGSGDKVDVLSQAELDVLGRGLSGQTGNQ